NGQVSRDRYNLAPNGGTQWEKTRELFSAVKQVLQPIERMLPRALEHSQQMPILVMLVRYDRVSESGAKRYLHNIADLDSCHRPLPSCTVAADDTHNVPGRVSRTFIALVRDCA